MEKKLAIKGHPTRGKEVIELLKMMGGEAIAAKGDDEAAIYVIPVNGIIDVRFAYEKHIDNYAIFTLEEFLEKYPFKIHDLVNIPEYESTVGICGMRWDSYSKRVEYMVYRNDDEEWYIAEELLNYNDNPTQCLDVDCCTNNITKSPDNVYSISKCKTIGQGTYAIKIADGYKFDSIDENGNIIVKSIKPIYPKTYEECCEIIHSDPKFYIDTHLYSSTLETLYKLLICRDAYWKIAEDWKPDWNNIQDKHCIYVVSGELWSRECQTRQCTLAFPTAEMRDTFYENFKDLIKQCKELL